MLNELEDEIAVSYISDIIFEIIKFVKGGSK